MNSAGRASAYLEVIDTPVGLVFIGGSEAGVHRLDFLPDDRGHTSMAQGNRVREFEWSLARLERETGLPAVRDADRAAEVARQMRDYFAGERATFDVPPEQPWRGGPAATER